MPTNKQYWTAAQILQRVKDELDLNEETFIDDVEMVRYCNAAIDRAEQQVIGIHKDYFLTYASLDTLAYPSVGSVTIGGLDGNVITLAGGWPSDIRPGDEISLDAESYDTRYKILSIDGDEATVEFAPSVPGPTDAQVNFIGLRSGVREYALPSDMYAHKIRRIIYENGSQVYKVNRIRDWKKFERKAIEDVNNTSTLLEYFPINRVPGEPRIQFVPKPAETGDFITVWYCRQANRFDDSFTLAGDDRVLDTPLDDPTNILDVPEAFNYIVEFVKMKCDIKEKRNMGQVQTGDYPEVMLEYKELIGAIQEMIPDGDNEIEADYSTYEEHS